MCLTSGANRGYKCSPLRYDIKKDIFEVELRWKWYPIGKWLTSSKGFITDIDYLGLRYPAGFHIFLDRRDALSYADNTIFEVSFEDTVYLGKQNSDDKSFTAIARKMLIHYPNVSINWKQSRSIEHYYDEFVPKSKQIPTYICYTRNHMSSIIYQVKK